MSHPAPILSNADDIMQAPYMPFNNKTPGAADVAARPVVVNMPETFLISTDLTSPQLGCFIPRPDLCLRPCGRAFYVPL